MTLSFLLLCFPPSFPFPLCPWIFFQLDSSSLGMHTACLEHYSSRRTVTLSRLPNMTVYSGAKRKEHNSWKEQGVWLQSQTLNSSINIYLFCEDSTIGNHVNNQPGILIRVIYFHFYKSMSSNCLLTHLLALPCCFPIYLLHRSQKSLLKIIPLYSFLP